ncbi:MAG: hypothetical protein ACE5ET_00510, partial [Gammaproteobacteria bacterium]
SMSNISFFFPKRVQGTSLIADLRYTQDPQRGAGAALRQPCSRFRPAAQCACAVGGKCSIGFWWAMPTLPKNIPVEISRVGTAHHLRLQIKQNSSAAKGNGPSSRNHLLRYDFACEQAAASG